MKTLFVSRSRKLLRKWRLRRAAHRRSWLANAIINSIAIKSEAGDQDREWQTVRPPAFVHIFRRARRGGGASSFSYIIGAGFLCAACLAGVWLSERDAQARCGEGQPTSGQCVEGRLAENARRQQRPLPQPVHLDPLKPGATGIPAN
jgi:hypothetical protein